jgi:hypothetical protein
MQFHRLLSAGQRTARGLPVSHNPILNRLIRRSSGPPMGVTAALGALTALSSYAISREAPLYFEPVIAALALVSPYLLALAAMLLARRWV